MKTFRNVFLFLTFLLGYLFIPDLSAEPPSPPAGGHGAGNNQPPAGAPIDGGLGILFVLGATFAGIKHYKNKSDYKENR